MKKMMKKKFLTFTLATTMVVGSVFGSIAATTASSDDSLTDGLVGYYTFDDTLENEVTGESAKLHGGAGDTWNAEVTGSASYATGVDGKAYSFLGTSGDVSGEGLELDVTTGADFTISMWVNASEKINYQPIIFTNIDGDNYVTAGTYYNDYASGGIINYATVWTWLDKNDTDSVSTIQDLPTDTWVYLTLTMTDEGVATLYYNAEVLDTDTISDYTSGYFEDMPIFLGINWWDASFKGLMDNVAVYDRALSADEVAALYEADGIITIEEETTTTTAAASQTEKETTTQEESTTSPSPSKVAETKAYDEEESTTSPSPSKVAETSSVTEDESSSESETTTASEDIAVTSSASSTATEPVEVTASAAAAIAKAAVITNTSGEALDAVLTVSVPDDDTVAAATKLVTDNDYLTKAGMSAFAVLDLSLTSSDGSVKYTELGNKIRITIPVDSIFADIAEKAYVAVYRVDTINNVEQLSYLGYSQVSADKTISFDTNHFSTYVFAVVDDVSDLGEIFTYPSGSTAADVPLLGDTTPVIPLVVLAVVALGGVIAAVASKKRA